jgi:hypothetical protein
LLLVVKSHLEQQNIFQAESAPNVKSSDFINFWRTEPKEQKERYSSSELTILFEFIGNPTIQHAGQKKR